MINQNIPYREETPIRQDNQNGVRIHNTRNDTNNINTENHRVNNNYIENDQSNNKSGCEEFCEPDCCFCSNTCCCDCQNSSNYPELNAFNSLIFTIISELAILFILFFFTSQTYFRNGHEFFFSRDETYDLLVGLYIIFGIEILIYLPFVVSCFPCYEGNYPQLVFR